MATDPQPNQQLEDFLKSAAGKKACNQKQKEILQVLGGLPAIISVYNRNKLFNTQAQEKFLSIFNLNKKVEKKKVEKSSDDSKSKSNDEYKSSDIPSTKTEMSPAEITKEWKAQKKTQYDSQAMLFLNVLWAKYQNEKDDIYKIFSIYREKHLKFGEKDTAVGFGTFCNVLELCEKNNKRVADCQSKYIGKPSISKRFQALGMKLGGEVSLIECLLYVYGENMKDFIAMPRSPMDAKLKEALANQAKVKADGMKLSNERDALVEKMKTVKPMKKAQMDLDLKKLENDINKNAIPVKRANKAQAKLVASAQQAYQQENSNGTVPTNWFKEQLGVATGVRAAVTAEKNDYDGGGDYAKQNCSQCGKSAFGKVDKDDGNFYCNGCWASF